MLEHMRCQQAINSKKAAARCVTGRSTPLAPSKDKLQLPLQLSLQLQCQSDAMTLLALAFCISHILQSVQESLYGQSAFVA